MQTQQQQHQHQHQQSHDQINNSHDQQSSHNHLALSRLKHQITLTNHQLLQLTYNDQKFLQKLKQLNHHGCQLIKRMQFTEALIYLTQAEKVLEYAASCGKTISRKLIISTLNNQASLYQKAWQLEKAESYLEAIIYNITSSFDNNSEQKLLSPSQTNSKEFTPNILDKTSTEYQDYSIALWKKKSLAIFYLQYCAINSQNKNNKRAFTSAQKSLNLIKQVCMNLYSYEKYIQQIRVQNQQHNEMQQYHQISSNQSILYQLGSFEQIQMRTVVSIEPFYKTAVRHVAIYIKRLQSNTQGLSQQAMEKYRKCFENYSIGTIMQITPSQLDEHVDTLDLSEQINIIQKHFQAIYLSVGHFILGTQSRFIASEKYSLNENQRRGSIQFQQSQIYHLCSIIILTRFLLCESGYFDHIVNSFRNHYRVDILEDAQNYLESHPQFQQEETLQPHKYIQLFHKEQNPSQNSLNTFMQQDQESKRVQEIKKVVSEVQIVYLTPGKLNDDIIKEDLYLNTQESLEYGREKHSSGCNSKTTKISKNTIYSHINGKEQKHHEHQGSEIKKTQHKKPINQIPKNSSHIQIHQNTKYVFMTTQQPKQPPKSIQLLTSLEKENKQKPTQLNSNTNRSKSKRKSDCLFLSNTKKMYTSKQKITNNIKQRVQSKRETIYSKRQTNLTPKKISRSKSKNQRLLTSNEGDKKEMRRKDSYMDLKKTKRVQEQYGSLNHGSNKHLRAQVKTSRSNINSNANTNNHIKKSKNKRQSEQKLLKLSSPDLKFKKLKSPRNVKK